MSNDNAGGDTAVSIRRLTAGTAISCGAYDNLSSQLPLPLFTNNAISERDNHTRTIITQSSSEICW